MASMLSLLGGLPSDAGHGPASLTCKRRLVVQRLVLHTGSIIACHKALSWPSVSSASAVASMLSLLGGLLSDAGHGPASLTCEHKRLAAPIALL